MFRLAFPAGRLAAVEGAILREAAFYALARKASMSNCQNRLLRMKSLTVQACPRAAGSFPTTTICRSMPFVTSLGNVHGQENSKRSTRYRGDTAFLQGLQDVQETEAPVTGHR